MAGTIRAMLRASTRGHHLSDNGLYNFGMIRSNVVIIDAGCKTDYDLNKSDFNIKCMRKLWPRLHGLGQESYFRNLQQMWQHSYNLHHALEAFEAL